MGGSGLAIALFSLLFASAIGAQDLDRTQGLEEVLEQGDVEVSADYLEYERSRGLYTARGDVVLQQGPRTIRADWLSFNQRTGVGVASGNVVVEEGGNVLRSSFVEFDVYGVRGVVRDGSFDSSANQFRASGQVIEKTGPDTYSFTEGVFTTCRCPEEESAPPWRVTAEKAQLEIEGYAVVQNTTLEVLGVPVLWLPWMIYPIKTKRQSGLLLPEVQWSGRGGAEIDQPLFLALHDRVNLTLSPGYSSERGGRGSAELEYVFGDKSSGEVSGTYARDISIDTGAQRFGTPFGRDRYVIQGAKNFFLPGDLRFRARGDIVSDNQVPLDLKEAERRRADRRLAAEGWLGRDFGRAGRYGAFAEARISDDMQNPDDRDRDDTLLQRLAGGRASVLPGETSGWSWLVPSLDANYAYFRPFEDRRNEFAGAVGPTGDFLDVGVDGVLDADERSALVPGPLDPHGDNGFTELDGRFQEGEPLLDTGHRLILHPRLAVPFQAGSFLEIYPEVGWHQTLYHTDLHDFDERGFATARLEARSRMRGRVGSYVHFIEPRAGWALALVDSDAGNPRFVPRTALPQQRLRTLDLDNVTRDDADRRARAHVATLGVTNRFLAADGQHGIDFTLLGRYDLVSEAGNQLVADATVRNAWGFRGRLQAAFDPAAVELDEGLVSVGWGHASGLEANVRYRFLRDIPDTFEAFPFGQRWDDEEPMDRVHQIGAGVSVPVTRRWTAGYRGAYSFERNELFSSAASLEYFSVCGCWSAGVEFSGDVVSGIGFRVLYSLQGFGLRELPGDRGVLDGV